MKLASGVIVAALLRRCDSDCVGAYLRRRGDETAGAIRIIDGQGRVWTQEYDLDTDTRIWRIIDDREGAETRTLAEAARDPDLWIIEVEGDPAPYL